MNIRFDPVRIATGSEEDGVLAFLDGKLIAVLVRLAPDNEIAPGEWFMEASFDGLGSIAAPTFPGLDDVERWILSNTRHPI